MMQRRSQKTCQQCSFSYKENWTNEGQSWLLLTKALAESGTKRTSLIGWPMSANDPKRTSQDGGPDR
jgi:hypothetical protein